MDLEQPSNLSSSTPNPLEAVTGKGSVFANLKKNPRAKIVLVAVLAVILVVGGAWLISSQRKPVSKPTSDRPWNDNPKFPPTQVVTKVGGENIYGDDLNYELSGAYEAYKNNQKISDQELKNLLIKETATKSAIIQAAVAENIVTLSPLAFNSSLKDFASREALITKIRETIQSQSTKMSFSSISIWYYNMYPPKIPADQAKQMALSKMTKLYNQLINKQITLVQAGDFIKNDPELAKIDRNYKGNAFVAVSDKYPTDLLFNFTKLQDFAASMKNGELSPILNVESELVLGSKPLPEKLYIIIKADKVVIGKYISYEDWVKKATGNYGNIQ